jgi:hypothetical protein
MRKHLRKALVAALACLAVAASATAAQADDHLFAGTSIVPVGTPISMVSTGGFTISGSGFGLSPLVTCTGLQIDGTYTGYQTDIPGFIYGANIQASTVRAWGTGTNGNCTSSYLGGTVGVGLQSADWASGRPLCFGMGAGHTRWGAYGCTNSNSAFGAVTLRLTMPSGQQCFYTAASSSWPTHGWTLAGTKGVEPETLTDQYATHFTAPVTSGCYYAGTSGMYIGTTTQEQQFIVRETSGVNIHVT